MLKISLIVTVFNEEKTILLLLDAIAKQTRLPDEMVIVDGGSTDQTVKLIQKFQLKNPNLNLKLKVRVGNISVGRNYAIKLAQNNLLAITDAGCIPHPDWLQELAQSYESNIKLNPVIAGYYQGQAQNHFEMAVIPYVLVMKDKLDPNNFLPASRSMLLPKSWWQKVGGFDEKLQVSEDYALAKKLKASGAKIIFNSQAVVAWLPKKNLSQFARMVYLMAKSDAQAGIIRFKVYLIFLRYLILISGLCFSFWLPTLGFSVYLFWSVFKNYRYAKNGWYYLPILQFVSDIMVMLGTIVGVWS